MSRSVLGGVRRPFRALVVAFVPEAADLTPEAWAEGETLVEGMLGRRPPTVRRKVRVFIRILDLWALVRAGRGLAGLEPARRAHLLEGLQDSRSVLVRRGVWGLRTLAFLLYYGRREARRTIGYGAAPEGWDAAR